MPRTLAAVLSALALFPVVLHAQKHNMPGMEVKEHPPAHQHEAQPMQMGAMMTTRATPDGTMKVKRNAMMMRPSSSRE